MSAQIDVFEKDMQFAIDGAYLAAVCGVSTRQIRNYVADGMPTLARDRYDIRECVAWWVDTYKTPAKATTEVTARSKLADVQRRRVEIEIDQTLGVLVKAETVAATLNEIGSTIAALHDSFGPKHSFKLARETDPGAIQLYLFKELRKIRAQIADKFGQFAKDPAAKKTRKPRAKPKRAATTGGAG